MLAKPAVKWRERLCARYPQPTRKNRLIYNNYTAPLTYSMFTATSPSTDSAQNYKELQATKGGGLEVGERCLPGPFSRMKRFEKN